MPRLAVSLISVSLICGPSAFAQQAGSLASSNFPASGYLPLPPHFQPRRGDAANRVTVAPPPVPSYAQPPIPEDGDLWMPGFWAWRNEVPDYYWVPGTWVKPPRSGLLWTPPYWSRVEGGYAFQAGYWADTVGFYGGIDYGHGYPGNGYQGGHWENDTLFYNRAVNNFGSVDVTHVYDQAIERRGGNTRVSFDGGSRGTNAAPTAQQQTQIDDQHVAPTVEQQAHFEMAAKDRALYSKLNGGIPGLAATSRTGEFDGRNITRSSGLPGEVDRSKQVTTTGANTN